MFHDNASANVKSLSIFTISLHDFMRFDVRIKMMPCSFPKFIYLKLATIVTILSLNINVNRKLM